MRVPVAAQFLSVLGLVCLNGTLLCGAEDVYNCFDLKTKGKIKTGDVVTTKPYGRKSWCGSKKGKFLAVSDTNLLYLQCSRDAQDPVKAKVTIFDLSNLSYYSETIIFDSAEECIIKRGTHGQADRLAALANRLSEVEVPYHRTYCNAQHYFQYLLQGKVDNENTTAVTCPVFSTFTDAKSVRSNDFRLADKNYYYNWPVSSLPWIFNPGGELTIAERKTTWNPPSAQFNGSTRGASGNSSRWGSGSFRGLRRRTFGKSSNASKTQRQIDTASRFRGGGGGWGNPTNPSGTGGKTPTSYPAGAYPYSHGQNTSAASGLKPPTIYRAITGTWQAGYRMLGNGH